MSSRFQRLLLALILITINSIKCSYTYFAIEQCPGTDVPNIRHQTQFNEISVIFYYTQWSEESLEALKHYNDVAEHFGDRVYFAAVDCWHLACNCSKTLTITVGSGSPHKWPTLMVHYGRQGQLKIQYNGLFTYRAMVQFLKNVMQPLERLANRQELDQMKASTDAIVMGVFENANVKEYKQYLMASLKWLEHDPIRSYCFIVNFVKPNDTNVKVPNLLLQNHKTKKSFVDYHDFKWNASNIVQWLQDDLNDDYSLLHGYTTPITIAQKIKKQPVLVIFVNQPQQFFGYMEKYVDKKQHFTKASLVCKKSYKRKVKIGNSQHVIRNLPIFSDSRYCHYYNPVLVLKNLYNYYEINHYMKELYQQFANPALSQQSYNPTKEIYELLDFYQHTECILKKDIALQTTLHISVVKRLDGYLNNEQHLQNSNRSLATVLLDTQRYQDYLENLDITPTPKSMATVILIDQEKENMFIMEDTFAMYNLMEFVKKFYNNGLTNYYKNKENIPANSLTRSSYTFNYDIELKHLNRVIFLNNLQHSHNQTLIVLIYSPDCALCGNIQHSFIQLSLLLRHIPDLNFIRINVMDNDLPWQYNMPFLPALLVFPEQRFSESRMFPLHLKPDIRNVFGFILSQLKAQQQVSLVLAMCQRGSLPAVHSQSCWQFAKTILMQHIGKHLQYWQMFEAERSLIFERLRAFKDMSLDIQRNLRL
ncbi:uncharacterized protein LOC111688777 [Lucilia cuprina]|uniref:uncharacterized protein LOC111688777 n=1 Tax=Lucilia cuprina TaxID=7375 RepID=UPI001F0639AE|nr:uncharacterized protein LOC111688777 [Lucilia cuprina]